MSYTTVDSNDIEVFHNSLPGLESLWGPHNVKPWIILLSRGDLHPGQSIWLRHKNSNLWKTNVYRSENSNEFEHSPKYSYSMDDKDVYILNVKNVHSVESTSYNLGRERYVLTYTLKTR